MKKILMVALFSMVAVSFYGCSEPTAEEKAKAAAEEAAAKAKGATDDASGAVSDALK